MADSDTSGVQADVSQVTFSLVGNGCIPLTIHGHRTNAVVDMDAQVTIISESLDSYLRPSLQYEEKVMLSGSGEGLKSLHVSAARLQRIWGIMTGLYGQH